jgi:hypothetical protein
VISDQWSVVSGQERRGLTLMSTVLAVGLGSGGDAAAKLVDGYDPGDGARECEAGQNCFDAERAEKAPVAV